MDCGGIMLKLPADNMVQLRDIFIPSLLVYFTVNAIIRGVSGK